MVDRDRAQGRGIGAAPAAGDPALRDTESHDTPVPNPALATTRPGVPSALRRGERFPVDDTNSDGETRKLQGYALDQLLVASLEGPARDAPERAHDPSLEFAESSWPDDLALEAHPALVDDDEDVPTQAGPLRPTAPPGPPDRAPSAANEDATTQRRPASSAVPPPQEPPVTRGELPSAPPGGQGPWGNEPAPPPAPASAAPAPEPPPPESPGPSRAVKIIVFAGMTALGGGLAAFLYGDPQRPRPAAPPLAGAPSAPASLAAPLPSAPASLAAPLPAPSAEQAPSVSAAPSASAAPLASASAAPAADGAASTDDTAALEALGLLREGIGACVHKVGALPGSSPAVPRLLTMTRAPGFITLRPDWSTAVFGCAGFRLTAPMRFQIQWQVVKLNVEGLGVAWIDHDGDGTPDRAFAFRATAGAAKGEIQLGEIAPIEPTHPVLPVY